MENIKIKFTGHQEINHNYSQSGQDLFVLMCLNGKKNGTFLDLGCNHPTSINNTYLLESKFNWKGISVDIEESLVSLFTQRKTKAFVKDATTINFEEVMSHYDSNHIDYLSLDLEPSDITLKALKNIPFDKVEFSVIPTGFSGLSL